MLNSLVRGSLGLVFLAVAATAAAGADVIPVKDLPVHPAMPDPLVFNDGRKVTTPEEWRHRREEMIQIVQDYEFGHMPPPPGNVSGADLQATTLTNGVAFRTVHLTFGPEKKLGFDIAIYVPPSSNPVPTIIELGYSPAPSTNEVASTNAPRRGGFFGRAATPESTARQFAEPLHRGYAVVTMDYQQCGADNAQTYRKTGFFPAYPAYDWNDIAAWAWGISRCVDYLQLQPFADKTNFITVGHSRCGQAVLLAGALDERIALTAQAGGGCAFRFAGKDRGGKEGIDEVASKFTYLFGPKFPEFVGQTDKLPCDQHWLFALAAPRCFIAVNALEDPYVNGNAVAQSYKFAKPVYDFLGVSDHLGINFRPGGHSLLASDWVAILDFADQKLMHREVSRHFDELPPAEKLH